MSEEAIRLPALPKPDVFRATWDGGVGWSQYHDERDPLPAEWDDGPPNEVRGFFDGEAVQEYARAAVLAERAGLLEAMFHDLMDRAEAVENRQAMYDQGRFTGFANALYPASPHCAKTLAEAVKWHGEGVAYVAQWAAAAIRKGA